MLGVLVLQHASGAEPVDEEVVAARVSCRRREQMEELQTTWLKRWKGRRSVSFQVRRSEKNSMSAGFERKGGGLTSVK